MRINGIDIRTYGAKQWNFTYEHNSLRNESEWVVGAAIPYLAGSTVEFQEFSVVLMMKAQGREQIRRNCSQILTMLKEPATLDLDGFATKFRAVLKSHSETERSLQKYHLLNLSFQGYEFGADVTGTGTGMVTITNPGNLTSPGVITVTPSADEDIIIDGLPDPITIEDCAADIPVTINGITGIIMQGETPKAADVEMWSLPAFAPGENRIVCSDMDAAVTVTITPLYM